MSEAHKAYEQGKLDALNGKSAECPLDAVYMDGYDQGITEKQSIVRKFIEVLRKAMCERL